MRPTTITDLRNSLIDLYESLGNGDIKAKDASEINNTAGKIIATAKAQLAYHALRGEVPNIPFLASDVESGAVLENDEDERTNYPALNS